MPKWEQGYQVTQDGDGVAIDDAFVLRVKKDPAAWLAAWHYAEISKNGAMADALRTWLLENQPEEEVEGNPDYDAMAEVRIITSAYGGLL